MKKIPGFVCMVFGVLFAAANTISGTVYDNDQLKTTFTTPHGSIKIYLPDDIRPGDMITGTVVAQPSGDNEKDQQKNFKELLDHKLMLPDGKTWKAESPFASQPLPFHFIAPASESALKLYGDKNVLLFTSPVSLQPQITTPVPSTPVFSLSEKVIMNDEPIVILSAGNTSPFVIQLHNYHSLPGNQKESYTLTASAASPAKSIFNLPPGLSGMYAVCVDQNGKVKTIDLINIVNLDASIGKNNLSKGETTELQLEVTGLEGCPYRGVMLELVNSTPGVIELENGNAQIFPVDQSDNPEAFSRLQPFQSRQTVTGKVPGTFIIDTRLRIPPSAYHNPLQAYIEDIRTPQQYYVAVTALRNDINNYLSGAYDPATAEYLRKIRDKYLTVSSGGPPIFQAKAQLSNLLNPLAGMPGSKKFFNSLTEMGKQHTLVAQQAATFQFVHPLNDLAATFNSQTRVLLCDTLYRDQLLQYLGAKQNPNGTYMFTLSDGNKPVIYSNVTITPADPNNPLNPGCGDFAEPLPVPVDKPGKDSIKPADPAPQTPGDETKTPAPPSAQDTTKKSDYKPIEWPKTPTTFKDSSGRWYKFYKDAECKTLYTTNNTDCQEQTERVKNEKTGAMEDKPTGRYEKWIFQPRKLCVKGTGFCTEMMMKTSVRMIFEDKDCERMITVETFESFQCQ